MKNIPNILTCFRFILVFVYIGIYYSSINNHVFYAMMIFLIAGITDILDGYLARKYQLMTRFGQVMDPLADKSMQITVLLTLAFSGYIQKWIVFIVLAKELFMIISGIVLYFSHTKIVIPSNIYGKVTTVLIYLAIILSVLEVNISTIIFVLVLIFSGFTLFQYIIIGLIKIKLFRLFRKMSDVSD